MIDFQSSDSPYYRHLYLSLHLFGAFSIFFLYFRSSLTFFYPFLCHLFYQSIFRYFLFQFSFLHNFTSSYFPSIFDALFFIFFLFLPVSSFQILLTLFLIFHRSLTFHLSLLTSPFCLPSTIIYMCIY